jgi:hypothetical protein
MRFPVLIAIVSLLLLASRHAFADILFIDLNCSASELVAAKKAADDRHEKLIVLPPRSDEQQSLYSKDHELDLTKELLGNLLGDLKGNSKTNQTKIAELQRRVNTIDQQEKILKTNEQALGLMPAFSTEQLEGTLKEYAKNRKTFESVIISGHHSDHYYGQFGDLNAPDRTDDPQYIGTIFAKYPTLLHSVRSFYGWGCYSAEPLAAIAWQNAFPNLSVVGGYDASAPGAESSPSSTFLSSLLQRESTLEKMSEDKATANKVTQIAQFIRSIEGFNHNGSVCTCEECVGASIGVVSLTKLNGCNGKALEALNKGADFEQSMTDIPCNTRTSALRSYYDLQRQYSYCKNPGSEMRGLNELAGFDLYAKTVNQTILEIFMAQVLKNFSLFYANQIKQYQALLSSCGDTSPNHQINLDLACAPDSGDNPKKLHFEDLDKLKNIGMASSEFGSCMQDPKIQADIGQILCALSHITDLPTSWVDPVDDPSKLEKPKFWCPGSS